MITNSRSSSDKSNHAFFKGALCEGGDILKMKESAFSKVNLATKNEKNTTWVYLTGLLERIIFGIETLPVC